MYIPLEVILCGNPNVLFLIRMIITIIGFTAMFLTLNFYKCEWLRFVFVFLGVTGLTALLLFMLNGSLCTFGVFGSIGIVLTLHCLVLRQIKGDLNRKKCRRPCSEIISSECYPPCPPRPCPPRPCKKEIFEDIVESVVDENPICKGFKVLSQKLRPCPPPCPPRCYDRSCCDVEKKSCCNESYDKNNQIIKSNEIKFTESMENSCYGNKYNKSYHKKSYYNNKCSDKSCKKCCNYSNVRCNTRKPCNTKPIRNVNPDCFTEMYNM